MILIGNLKGFYKKRLTYLFAFMVFLGILSYFTTFFFLPSLFFDMTAYVFAAIFAISYLLQTINYLSPITYKHKGELEEDIAKRNNLNKLITLFYFSISLVFVVAIFNYDFFNMINGSVEVLVPLFISFTLCCLYLILNDIKNKNSNILVSLINQYKNPLLSVYSDQIKNVAIEYLDFVDGCEIEFIEKSSNDLVDHFKLDQQKSL